jgi:tripartite-type tricarboxylate transporter receptor subunit TctC
MGKIIVPAPPGGGTDAVAQVLADGLTVALGQTFIVENRPGGQTTIGTNVVAKAAPDGYTLPVGASAHIINDVMLPNLPYDSWKDFTHLTRLTAGPSVLVASKDIPAKNASELAARADFQRGPGAVVSTQEEFIEFEKREHAFYKRLVTEGIVKPVKQ